MSVRIVFTRDSDGGVSVVTPEPKSRQAGETVQQWLTRVTAKAMANAGGGSNAQVIDHTDLPGNRRWRNAWRRNGSGVVVIQLAAARLLRRGELLRKRALLVGETANGDHRPGRLEARLMRHLARGESVQAATLAQRIDRLEALTEAALDAELALVPDLAALDAFTPADLEDE